MLFLTTNNLQDAKDGGFIISHVKVKREWIKIPCLTQKDYATYMNGVDRNDRYEADFLVNLKSNWWYLRLLFLMFDQYVNLLHIIVC